MNNDPTPQSAPQMHAAANESIEAMFRKGCYLERQLAEVTKQRDMLADALWEAQLQLEYLNEKHPSGTTLTIIVRNELALAAVEGENNE